MKLPFSTAVMKKVFTTFSNHWITQKHLINREIMKELENSYPSWSSPWARERGGSPVTSSLGVCQPGFSRSEGRRLRRAGASGGSAVVSQNSSPWGSQSTGLSFFPRAKGAVPTFVLFPPDCLIARIKLYLSKEMRYHRVARTEKPTRRLNALVRYSFAMSIKCFPTRPVLNIWVIR